MLKQQQQQQNKKTNKQTKTNKTKQQQQQTNMNVIQGQNLRMERKDHFRKSIYDISVK